MPSAYYLEAARHLDLACEVLNDNPNHIRVSNGHRELRIYNSVPSCNDVVSEELCGRFGSCLEFISSCGVPVSRWRRLGRQTGDEFNTRVRQHMELYGHSVLSPRGANYGWILKPDSVGPGAGWRTGLEAGNLLIRPWFPERFQVLQYRDCILDCIEFSPPTVAGNGTHTLGELLATPGQKARFPAHLRDRILLAGEQVCVADPALGTGDRTRRIDLSGLSSSDMAFFRRLSRVCRTKLAVFDVARDDSGQWHLQFALRPRGLRGFTLANATDKSCSHRRILHKLLVDPVYEKKSPSIVTGSADVNDTLSDDIKAFINAGNELGLKSELPDSSGEWLRITGNGEQLEISVRWGRYPNVSCTGADCGLLAKEKDTTASLLARADVPVPRHRLFDLSRPGQLRAALQYAGDNYPVVIKPRTGSSARGVTTAVDKRRACLRALEAAAKYGNHILVEEYIRGLDHEVPGTDFRIHVCRDRVVMVRKRIPAHVVGDGLHTVAQLVDQKNALRTRRGKPPIPVDANNESIAILHKSGLTPDSIPGEGLTVPLAGIIGELLGGEDTSVDLGTIHPVNIDMLRRAARAIDLIWAGIDFISPNLSIPYTDVRCAVSELNTRPSIAPFLALHPGFVRCCLIAYFRLKHSD